MNMNDIQNALNLFKNMTLIQTYISCTMLIFICILTMALIINYMIIKATKKEKPKPWIYPIQVIAFVILIFTATAQINAIKLNTIADKHGFYQIDTMPIKQIYPEIDALPEESDLPENITDMTVIYYKFGCPDCKAIHKNLHDQLKVYDNIYYIYTRSKTGKRLRKTYPVKKVPSAIYIDKNKRTYTCVLYKKQNRHAKLDWDNLNKLIKFMNHNEDQDHGLKQ